MLPDTSGNSSFSRQQPLLQLAIDSTSLGEFKICPRRYYYSIICGYQPRLESVHLTFGLLLHGALERYHHSRAHGVDFEAAQMYAVAWALNQTWDSARQRPWASDHKTKNRLTLIRTLVWYLDEHREDALETIRLASGLPAVELSFRFDSGFRTSQGEVWLLCGHLDRVASFAGQNWIVDVKSTEHTIGPGWFSKFTPDNQFSMYTLASQVALGVPAAGLIVDGAQVAVTFSRFQRGPVSRDKAQIDEWLEATGQWLRVMESCASDAAVGAVYGEDPVGAWPQNDKSCGLYGGCTFREVCGRSPALRADWLERNYRKRVWDPLERRGDI